MSKLITYIVSLSISGMAITGCGSGNRQVAITPSSPNTLDTPDTLHAATLYGPTSYFSYRGQQMGFDFENVRRFAEDEGMVLDLKVAPSLPALLKMLTTKEVELAAYPVPVIEEYNSLVKHCGYKEVTWQVLVQPGGKDAIKDVTELVGKTVYVEKDSKYHYRLSNLNQELGGGIDIIPISRDSLITEELIAMVDRGEIPLTVVDSDVAELNKSYFPHLDTGLKISLDQYSSWAVATDCDSLALSINNWKKRKENSQIHRAIYKKYFEISKSPAPFDNPEEALGVKIKKRGHVSNYDALFKRYSSIPGYDWQLLASIGFNESCFDNDVVSWAGAMGVMQLMAATARSLDVEPELLVNPDVNILTAARLLKNLDDALADKVPDKNERILFVIAAYNCGLGHIYDSIALAKKYGLDPQTWTGNVSEAALLKSRPQYYNDPVVKNGYFRGSETVEFVEKVMSVYNYFKNSTK
ncbi:MAG: transglycosylase SLT domain-containing protein [Bacteroides sp.]|nr:transglycosylase SLT domain-containing protein [Bacteroides sp.]